MAQVTRKPPWLKKRLPPPGQMSRVHQTVEDRHLHTVCTEAHCPNQMECFGKGTATFLLLGPSCTRRCTFCAVDKQAVRPPDPDESANTADAAAKLGLDFVVLTMVTRDDLPDGGAEHVARTIRAIRERMPEVGVEVLISDLGGDEDALNVVLAAKPEVLNHNIETVPRLYPTVRPGADYHRSLELLARAAQNPDPPVVKSGMMLGLGETDEEILTVLDDLRAAGCRLVTLGQYLSPGKQNHPVVRWVPPEDFDRYREEALKRGFDEAASSPFVRSSYQAGHLYRQAIASRRS